MNTMLTPEACAAIVNHMHANHADANAAYARVFGGVAGVRSAEMIALDEAAMELAVETAAGRVVTRIDFDHILSDSNDARDTRMAGRTERLTFRVGAWCKQTLTGSLVTVR
jgi:putative heme iron utilization protein